MKTCLFTFILSVFVLVFAGAQTSSKVDSLRRELRNTTGENRYILWERLVEEYTYLDRANAIQVVLEAEQDPKLSHDTLWMVKSQRIKAQLFFTLGDIRKMISIYEFAYPIAQQMDFPEEATLLANIGGSAYLLESRFDKALDCFFQAHEIAVHETDTSGLASTLHNIGITYYKLKNYKKGLTYLERSWTYKKMLNDLQYFTPMNISLCYVELSNYEKARIFLNESRALCGPDCNSTAMIHIKYASGCIFLAQADYDRAELELLSSYSIAKRTNNIRMQLDNIYLLAKIYLARNQHPKAVQYLEEAERANGKGSPFNLEMIKIYSRFSELYLANRNFERASFYQQKYIDLKDSVYNEALINSLMKTEAQFLELENQARIADKNDVIMLKEKVIYHQRLLMLIAFFLATTILALFFFLLRNYQEKKNLNGLLEQKVRERTRELESGRDQLLRTIKEKELQISRIAGVITETINTVDGLCVVGGQELSEVTAHSYLRRIRKTVNRLATSNQSI